MKAELITDLSSVGPIEDEWARLAEARGNAFLTPSWFRAWATPALGDRQPMIAAVRRQGGELAGVLPLVLDTSARPRALRFGGAGFGDRFGVASMPHDEDAVAVAAIEALESGPAAGSILVLHRVDAGSRWPAAMAAASRRRLAIVEQSRAELPHTVVAGLDWDSYVAARSKKFRQRVARGLERGLDRHGITHEVRETSDPASLDADMGILFHLHDLRKAEGESSISSPEVRKALTAFAREALARGWLRLRILELDGQHAAAMLAWRIGPSYGIYQTGFDPAWAEHSAGMLLFKDTVRSAIDEDAEDVDFLLGSESYKWRFAPEARQVRTLVLVGAWQPARLLVSAEAAARQHGRGLMSRPRLKRAAQAVARALPGGRT